jgi:hypothetical protein
VSPVLINGTSCPSTKESCTTARAAAEQICGKGNFGSCATNLCTECGTGQACQ